MGPDAARPAAPGVPELDATGRFVMPGLTDLHVHTSAEDFPLFLANGVTTVRELNGSPRHLSLREQVRSGAVAGPRLFVSTPLLTGQSWSVRHAIVPDADSARAAVRAAAAAGYDWIKVYDGLSAATYEALVTAARAAGLPLTGHIPESVGLAGVLAARQDLEHVEKIAWFTGGMAPDPAGIPEVVRQVKAAGVRLTATLWSQRALSMQGTVEYDSLFNRSEMAWVDASTRGWWGSLRRDATARFDPSGRSGRMHAYQRALVLALFQAGVPILVGTDTPNPMLVPGFSMHDELEALVDAGLPVAAVLHSATALAGEVLGLPGRLGVVRAGAMADLLVLAADPLVELGTLRRPLGVVAGGRLYDRAALDGMLAGARR